MEPCAKASAHRRWARHSTKSTGTQRLANGLGGVRFGGDEDELAGLPFLLPANQIGHKWRDFLQIGTQEEVGLGV
jgi:hypothetical protein